MAGALPGQINFQKHLVADLDARVMMDGHALSATSDATPEDAQVYLLSVATDPFDNMVIRLRLPELVGQERYELAFFAGIAGKRYRIQPEWMSQHRITRQTQQQVQEITWYNAFDHIPFQVGAFTLSMIADFYGEDYPCPNEAPVFTWAEQRRHLIAGGAGVALIGVAQLGIMQKANDNYDRYRRAILSDGPGTPPPGGLANPERLLEDARDQEKTANFMTLVGGAVVVGSAVTYVIRTLRIKRDHQDWIKYCDDNQGVISLAPRYEMSAAGASAGLALTIRF